MRSQPTLIRTPASTARGMFPTNGPRLKRQRQQYQRAEYSGNSSASRTYIDHCGGSVRRTGQYADEPGGDVANALGNQFLIRAVGRSGQPTGHLAHSDYRPSASSSGCQQNQLSPASGMTTRKPPEQWQTPDVANPGDETPGDETPAARLALYRSRAGAARSARTGTQPERLPGRQWNLWRFPPAAPAGTFPTARAREVTVRSVTPATMMARGLAFSSVSGSELTTSIIPPDTGYCPTNGAICSKMMKIPMPVIKPNITGSGM